MRGNHDAKERWSKPASPVTTTYRYGFRAADPSSRPPRKPEPAQRARAQGSLSSVSVIEFPRMFFGSSSRFASLNSARGKRTRSRWRTISTIPSSSGTSILAQCWWQLYLGHSSRRHMSLYSQNLAVIASRMPCSWVGKYMMMPTHECKSSSPAECAGLILETERAVHRCSMGAGTASGEASAIASSSCMKPRSASSGLERVPQGNATSETHCWPPHSNPSSLSDQSTR
mmetsp:Transcript_27561/g.72858  ORF Transcript_27561/g.72858 Transcript_27561/m.72858 type:complete len:229 (-) Transcript_27561:710-1396(-)